MTVEIICIGTEILLGNIVNTNACYLSKRCADMGLSMFYQTVVGDNPERLKEAVITGLERSDVIITSGGLGPTNDDISKEIVAEALGLPLHEDKESLENMKKLFLLLCKPMAKINYKQALIPDGAHALLNNNGTAPGIFIDTDETGAKDAFPGRYIFQLPGPPKELIPMVEDYLVPFFKEKNPVVIYSEMVKLAGIGESDAASKISGMLINSTNPTVAPYAKMNEVHLRITAKADSIGNAKEMVAPVYGQIEKVLGEYIYTRDEAENLEDAIVKMAAEKKVAVATAESLTGGLLGARIVNVSGASEIYNEGYITYSNEAKSRILGVSSSTLKNFGAVSPECAKEMALGALANSHADIAVSTTGIAGPTGGTEEKPVGLVYIAIAYKGEAECHKYNFTGDRDAVRSYTAAKALNLLWKKLKEI